MTSTTVDVRTTSTPVAGRRASPPSPPPASTAGARSTAPALRLTGRGRMFVVLVTVASAFGAFTMRGAPAASTDEVHHLRTATVVVTPGETVWDIAQRVAPDTDPRAIVAQIEELNALPDAGAIRAGQPLVVPKS